MPTSSSSTCRPHNECSAPTAQVDSIVVNGGDTPTDQLLADIAPVLPDGLEVVSGETVEQEQKDQFGSFINVFGNVLLGFAFVVLFVSIFIIYNTFAILVGQRTRQFGLLRSIGASSKQISFMVLVESVIIGLIASIVGLFGGVGVAALLKQLFSTAGGEFPDGPLEIKTRTIIVVVVVGLLVTVGFGAPARLPGLSSVAPRGGAGRGPQGAKPALPSDRGGGRVWCPASGSCCTACSVPSTAPLPA